jgi:hypothetical protein
LSVALPEDPTAEVEDRNRFSGEKTTDARVSGGCLRSIIGSETFGDYDTVRKGLDWFQTTFRSTIHGGSRLTNLSCRGPNGPRPTEYIYISIEVPHPNPIKFSLYKSIHLYTKRGPTTLGCIACFRQIRVV